MLSRSITNTRLLTLIGRYLRAGVLVGEHIQLSEVGTPQGGPPLLLLANIRLHQLNRKLQRRGDRSAAMPMTSLRTTHHIWTGERRRTSMRLRCMIPS